MAEGAPIIGLSIYSADILLLPAILKLKMLTTSLVTSMASYFSITDIKNHQFTALAKGFRPCTFKAGDDSQIESMTIRSTRFLRPVNVT